MGAMMSEEGKTKSGLGKKLGIGCLVLIGAVVILGVIGSMAGDPEGRQVAASDVPAAAPKDVLETTAREIARAYQDNEMRAKQKFGGKTLKVSGVVAGVTLDFMDNPVLQLESDNEFMPAQASFTKEDSDAMAALNKGDKVTITCGTITEVASMPMLDDCTI